MTDYPKHTTGLAIACDKTKRRPFITPLGFMTLAAYSLCAQVTTALYYRVTIESSKSKLIDLATLHASRPYQYRLLVPAMIGGLARPLHPGADQYAVIAEDLTFVIVIALLYAYRNYLAVFVSQSKALLYSFAIILPLIVMQVSCNVYRYPSDIPATLLFILGLTALYKRRWPALYACLLLSSLNRESAGLLVLAFALTMAGNLPRSLYLIHVLGLTLLFLAVQTGLHIALAQTTGYIREDHTVYNRYLLSQLAHLKPSIATIAACLATIPIMIGFQWNAIPAFARRLLPLAIVYATGMYFVGILDEVRSYNEVMPIVLTPLILVFDSLIVKTQPADATDSNAASRVTRLAA